jgi:hypothetical protein
MSKGFSRVFLSIFLLITIGGGAYLYNSWQTQKFVQQLSDEEKKKLVSPSESTNSASAKNISEYFFLNYPSEWLVRKPPNSSAIADMAKVTWVETVQLETKEQTEKILEGEIKVTVPTHDVTIQIYPTNRSVKTEVDQLQSTLGSKDFKRQSIKVNALNGEAVRIGIGRNASWYIFLSNGKYLAQITSSMNDPEGNSIENQIISTFKFVN